MAASVLAAGDIAIVSYATDAVGGTDDDDIIRFVLLKPIGSGTQIFFTDRAWNGSAFTNAAGDGTFAYSAGADLAAGTVITITSAQLAAAGMNLSDLTGDTIYVYQGSDADSPTSFLYAIDIADGNNVFNGSLANTGLVNGSTAVAIGFDQASYAGQSTQIQQTQLTNISNNAQWHGSDTNDSLGTMYDDRADVTLSGPLNNPDMQLFAVMAGGGQSDAVVRMDNDEASDVATNLTRLFRDNPDFNHLTDLSFDIEDGVFFVVDSDGVTTRILKGNIADLANGTSTPTLTVIFDDATPDQVIGGIEIDTVNNKVYFTEGDIFAGHSLKSVGYGGGAVTDYGPVALAVDSSFGFLAGGVFDFTLDVAHDTAYLTYTLVDTFFGPPNAAINYIVKVNSLADSGGGYSVVTIVGSDDPDGAGGNPANHFPDAEGSLAGIDIDIANQRLYFVTQRLGADGTGGVFRLDLATGIYTEIWEQPSNDAFNTLQPFPTTQMQYIEVDTIGGRYYLTTLNSSDTAASHDGTATDEGGSRIFSGSLTATPGTAPTVFATAFEPTSNGAPLGMEIDYAPILALSSGAGYTEGGPPGDVATSLVVSDPDQAVIKGATVAITAGLAAGDTLTFTPSGGITGSYNAATGVLTLSGNASFAAYQTVLDSVAFTAAGDNPTNYGANTTRTINFTVTDGLLNSDPATATITITATNDAPVNVVPGAQVFNEDAARVFSTANGNALSTSDVDADPAAQALSVTLSVLHGTLTLTSLTGLSFSGGSDGTNDATMTFTGTANAINAALGAGLTFNPTADYYGSDTLTFTVNDQGFNGNPGATQDSDTVTLTINAVADIANDAAVTNEDTAVNVLVLANDSFEGTPAITGVGPAAHGTVTINNNGTPGNTADDYLVYTPGADYDGPDSFTYTVTSGGATETATVNVAVNAVADIANDSVTVGEDSGANALDLLANDNFENAGRSISAVTQGLNGGTVAINNNGTPGDTTDDFVTYTPTADYNGPDSFTYTVTSNGTTETATVTVNVTGSNDDPVNITGGGVAATEDASVAVTGLQVSDIDSPSLSVTLSVGRGTLAVNTGVPGGVAAASGNGTASVTISGTQAQINATLAAPTGLVYTPTANLNGPDTLTMATSDGSGGSDTDLVSISVGAESTTRRRSPATAPRARRRSTRTCRARRARPSPACSAGNIPTPSIRSPGAPPPIPSPGSR